MVLLQAVEAGHTGVAAGGMRGENCPAVQNTNIRDKYQNADRYMCFDNVLWRPFCHRRQIILLCYVP